MFFEYIFARSTDRGTLIGTSTLPLSILNFYFPPKGFGYVLFLNIWTVYDSKLKIEVPRHVFSKIQARHHTRQ